MTTEKRGAQMRRRSTSHDPGKRRVMQITWSLVAGGSEVYAWNIASNMDAHKYSCGLCALDQGGALEEEIKAQGIPYFVMNRRPGIDLRLVWRLYRLFRKTRIQVIQTHHFNQLFYSFIGAKLVGARIIHTEHDTASYSRPRLRLALRLMSFFCHRVVAISDEVGAMLRDEIGISAGKIEIVRAGINLAVFNADDQNARAEARRVLRLDEKDQVVVIVARLFPEKNHLLLLGAFADVARSLSRARLLIVGEGVERKAIEEEIVRLGLGERVRVLGVRRDVPGILAASDVFVLASDREGLPIAALEAMAAGKPVVATAVGDLASIIQDGVTGYLVPRGDADALAAALTRVLDKQTTSDMGTNARRVASHYGLPSMLNRYEILYSNGSPLKPF
jgi:glycosyltransferase involved in cell wall biosynthesis